MLVAILHDAPFESTLYSLQTILLPVLLGFLSGYTGLILFAVFPGRFYSNFVVLGMIAFTVLASNTYIRRFAFKGKTVFFWIRL